jgi:hypothetical protein
METSLKTKDVIVNLIQASLKGKIKESESVSPQFIADAIIQKAEFNKPFTSKIYHQELISSLMVFIDSTKTEMNEELTKLKEDEKLLVNFIKGQITACDKFENFIKSL